jgi:hypothetical protein
MNQRIIYQNESGGVAIIIPCDCGLTIEQIAAKDVPDRTVFVQTGVAILTQDDLDESPGLWDGSGYTVGDEYPTGDHITSKRPFKIVDVGDIPADRQWRNEWAVDEADLTDGVGA